MKNQIDVDELYADYQALQSKRITKRRIEAHMYPFYDYERLKQSKEHIHREMRQYRQKHH